MVDEEFSIAGLRDPSQTILAFEGKPGNEGVLLRRLDNDCGNGQIPLNSFSAEHIADDRLLEQIFARSCPWLGKIEGADPCLVTGPRGCGKSTIFRWLSLRTHLHKSAVTFPSSRSLASGSRAVSTFNRLLGWIVTDSQWPILKRQE